MHQDYNQDFNEGLHSRPCFNSVTWQSQTQSQSEILGRRSRLRKGYSVVYNIWVGTAAWGKGSSEVSGPGRECFARLIQPLQPRETTVNGLQSFDPTRKKRDVSGRWGISWDFWGHQAYVWDRWEPETHSLPVPTAFPALGASRLIAHGEPAIGTSCSSLILGVPLPGTWLRQVSNISMQWGVHIWSPSSAGKLLSI